MRAKLKSLAVNRGSQEITLTVFQDVRKMFDELQGTDVDLRLDKWREKRSRDANGYAWVLIDKIAAKLGLDKTEVYREAIREIGGVSEIVCVRNAALDRLRDGWAHNGLGWQTETFPSKLAGCTNVILYYGSSTYNTKQMSSLIDHLVTEAKELGIETLPPEKLASMLEREELNK